MAARSDPVGDASGAIAEAWYRFRLAGFGIEHWEVDDPSSRGHIVVIASQDPT